MRILGMLTVCVLLSQQASGDDKPLSPFDAGRQLGKVEQALETCSALSALSKDEALKKELSEWRAEHKKLEVKIRTKAEKNESIGDELQTSRRLLEKGVGAWSGKLIEARRKDQATLPFRNPLLPAVPGRDVVVTMDFQDYMALQLLSQFAGNADAQKLMGRMQGQLDEAMKGLDLKQPGAGREMIQRLGKMAAENAKKGQKKQPEEPKK